MLKNYIAVFVLFIGLLYLFISCEEKAKEEIELAEDISYTDSFSPQDWEQPITRQIVLSGDKDIGFFINEDVLDPRQRQILSLMKKFINLLSRNKIDSIAAIFTPPAYNSFKLRMPKFLLRKKYTIRVSLPDNMEEKNLNVKCKIKFHDQSIQSIVGSFELENSGNNYKISDFENDFFDKLNELSAIKWSGLIILKEGVFCPLLIHFSTFFIIYVFWIYIIKIFIVS